MALGVVCLQEDASFWDTLKYLTIGECTSAEWKAGLFATEAIEKQATYELKMVEFVKSGVEQSIR